MTIRWKNYIKTVLLAAGVLAFFSSPVQAVSYITWTGAVNGNWDTTTTNWSGDSTTFTDNGSVNVTFNSAGNVTISPNMSPLSITVDNAATFNGGPIDSGTIIKSGGGALTLNCTNTSSGGITVNAGQLNINNAKALGTGTLTIKGGVVIENTSGSSVAVSTATPMSWEGDFEFKAMNNGTPAQDMGTGTVTLNGPAGSRQLTERKNAASNLNYPITIGGVIQNGSATGIQFNSGNAHSNYGFFILTGTNTYTGPTTLWLAAMGILRADDGVGLPAASLLSIGGGVFETGANLIRTGGSAAGNMQITGGNSGFSAYGAPVQVAFGTLDNLTSLTWGSAPFAPGTFFLQESTANNTLDFKNPVNLGNAGRTVCVNATDPAAVATMSGAISSSGSSGGLTKTGGGTLVLSGTNIYTGATTISAGMLEIGGSGQLGGGAYTNTISITAGTMFKYNSSANQTLSGIISGSGSLVKTNTGTLTLSGISTHNGPMIISAGTLEIGGSGQLGSGTYSANIMNNATFKYNSSADQTVIGVISGSGSLVKTNTGTLTLVRVNTYTGSTTVNAGMLCLSNACLDAGSTVYMAVGGKLDLAFQGTNTIKYLYMDGLLRYPGIYGMSAWGGTNYFSGSGFLKVSEGSALGTAVIVR